MNLCECGCGGEVRIAPKTAKMYGWVKGQPMRFIKGHSTRLRSGTTYKTKRTKYVALPNGCWEWQLSVSVYGYGQVRANGRTQPAHRWLYQKLKRVVLDTSLDLDHLCRNRRCVNPDHLEPVVHAVNVRRGDLATLTLEMARQIRSEYASGGTTYRKIAGKYGVSNGLIASIVKVRIWKEVKDVA
jgi:hypothetical protein